MGNNLGNTSTHNQITQCDKISESELLPGDLAFLMDEKGVTTHVGIYAGKRDGKQVWIHENAAANNVSMDTVNYWTGYYRLHIMKEK
jgi:cell wall-associated NlpC family hydrolase